MSHLPLDIVCRTQTFCRTCRDPAAGAWRQSLAAHYAVPPHAPDFGCPYGRPWGFNRPAAPPAPPVQAPRPTHERAAAREAVCRKCAHLSPAGICEVLWPDGCCAGRWYDFLKARASVCPLDRWPVMEDRR